MSVYGNSCKDNTTDSNNLRICSRLLSRNNCLLACTGPLTIIQCCQAGHLQPLKYQSESLYIAIYNKLSALEALFGSRLEDPKAQTLSPIINTPLGYPVSVSAGAAQLPKAKWAKPSPPLHILSDTTPVSERHSVLSLHVSDPDQPTDEHTMSYGANQHLQLVQLQERQ